MLVVDRRVGDAEAQRSDVKSNIKSQPVLRLNFCEYANSATCSFRETP